MLPSLRGSQLDIGPRPEVAEIANREVDCDTHLARHDDEAHVPAERGDNEQ
jgi:hypothetical protein